jgi:hypothetical protein
VGLLLIGVLAGLLLGFGVSAQSQGYFLQCAPPGCFDRLAARPPAPQPAAFRPDAAIAMVSSAATAKSVKRSPAAKRRSGRDLAKQAHPRKITVATTTRPTETPDPVLDKAKASIAAKMEEPASAEFTDMDRAFRKNTFGRAVDTICGHVRGKNGSGADTGLKPFLYLVKDDDAYVVDGRPDSAAAIAYRNICN